MNEFANAVFTFGCTIFTIEVLACDNIGGQLAPVLWELAVGLFEDDFAFFVFDCGSTQIPFYLGEGVYTFGTEYALEEKAGPP